MNEKKARIAVFVSGGGTNLQALLDAQQSGIIHSGEIVLVVSSNPDAYAIERAKNHGVPSVVVSRKVCGSQEAFEAGIRAALDEYRVDLIVLAGFMSILSGDFTLKEQGLCKLTFVDTDPKTADIQPGDRVLSSGLGSVYPPDLTVGEVVSVEIDPASRTLVATVRPLVDFAQPDYFMIVTGYQK